MRARAIQSRLWIAAIASVIAVTTGVIVSGALSSPASLRPGDATPLGGIERLSPSGNDFVNAVACSQRGSECVLDGQFGGAGRANSTFVASRSDDRWSSAHEFGSVLVRRSARGFRQVAIEDAICTGTWCLAAGFFDGPGAIVTSEGANYRPFVTTESNGQWSAPSELPGFQKLGSPVGGEVSSLACGSPGNCVVSGEAWAHVGHNSISPETNVAFVVAMSAYKWGQVSFYRVESAWPTATALDSLAPVSFCPSSSICVSILERVAAGGSSWPMQVIDRSGQLGEPSRVPYLDDRSIVQVATCSVGGYCVVGGQNDVGKYTGSTFLMSYQEGSWSHPSDLHGAGSGAHSNAELVGVTCPANGECVAAGSYGPGSVPDFGVQDFNDGSASFVTRQRAGTWQPAVVIASPMAASTSNYGPAVATALGWVAPGTCVLGLTEHQEDAGSPVPAYFASEQGGVWSPAREVPGTSILSTSGNAEVDSVSCTLGGVCQLAGTFVTATRGPTGLGGCWTWSTDPAASPS